MRLATFAEGSSGPRFGIVRGEHVIDVVGAANAMRRPVPATSVKAALTSGPEMGQPKSFDANVTSYTIPRTSNCSIPVVSA